MSKIEIDADVFRDLVLELRTTNAALLRMAERGGSATTAGDQLLTLDDVATKLGRSRRYVERLVRSGKLKKAPNQGKRTTRFTRAALEQLLEEAQPGRRRL